MRHLVVALFLCITTALSAEMKILAFSGSTRADSYNKKLLQEAVAIAKEKGAEVQVIDLKDYPMPFYDGDFEEKQGMPENAKKLRTLMCASDAMIIASPEYNASFSAVLKNAIDWVSRGETGGASRDAFRGKKFALMSASLGKSGGANGLKQLRDVITAIGGEVVSNQVVVPEAHTVFDVKEADATARKAALEQEIAQLIQ